MIWAIKRVDNPSGAGQPIVQRLLDEEWEPFAATAAVIGIGAGYPERLWLRKIVQN